MEFIFCQVILVEIVSAEFFFIVLSIFVFTMMTMITFDAFTNVFLVTNCVLADLCLCKPIVHRQTNIS